MLASIVLPIRDVRDFFDDGPQRMRRPTWPEPEPRQFVRSMGPIVPRPRGGVPVYGDEQMVCDVSNAIRFESSPHAFFSRFIAAPRIKCAYRRFFRSAAGAAKFEIGLALHNIGMVAISHDEVPDFLKAIVTLRARVRDDVNPATGFDGPVPRFRPSRIIAKLGSDLASLYAQASVARKPTPPPNIAQRIVYGEPLLILEVRTNREIAGPPRQAKEVKFLSDTSNLASRISLHQYWLSVENLKLRTWIISHYDGATAEVRQAVRFLRVTLARIHTERQFLGHVLTLIESGTLKPPLGSPAHSALRSAIDYSIKRLQQPRRSQIQREIEALYPLVLAAEDSPIVGKLERLEGRLRELKLGPNNSNGLLKFDRDAGPPTMVLFLSSTPSDRTPTAATTEAREIEERLTLRVGPNRFRFKSQWELARDDLAGLILLYRPRILHFCAHSSGMGELILVERKGTAELVDPESLTRLFATIGGEIRCVVLNACYTNIQAEVISPHVDFVVGMAEAIEPKVGVAFARAFYEALGLGASVRTAFTLAQEEARRTGGEGASAPRLYVRPGAQHDEVLFPLDNENSPTN